LAASFERAALLRADLLARRGADLEELPEAIVVEDDHVSTAVSHGLDGAPPVGDHRERTHDEHGARALHAEDRLPRGDGLAEPDVVGEEKAWATCGARGDDGLHRLLLMRPQHDRACGRRLLDRGVGPGELALDVQLPRIRQRAERRERPGQLVALEEEHAVLGIPARAARRCDAAHRERHVEHVGTLREGGDAGHEAR
jgi:hypothetical protein